MCSTLARSCQFFKSALTTYRIPALVQHRCKTKDVAVTVGWKPIPAEDKFTIQSSGDSKPFKMPQLSLPQLKFRTVLDELKKSDPVTARVLSLEFNNMRERRQYCQREAIAFVQRHRLDESSYEAIIARLTVHLRHLLSRVLLREHRLDKALRRMFRIKVTRRSRYLRRLRRHDYRRFEWLIEQLGIVFRPVLPRDARKVPLRKSGIRSLVAEMTEKIRKEKLDALRSEFDAQKPQFEREKKETLQWIASEERALGLPSSVNETEDELLEKRIPKRFVIPPRRDAAEYNGMPTLEELRK